MKRDRMTESKDELARMLGEDELRDAVLLVGCNPPLDNLNSQENHKIRTILSTNRIVHATKIQSQSKT